MTTRPGVPPYLAGPAAPTASTVLDCGHVPTPHGVHLPGYARDAETSATSCYPCAEEAERLAFRAADTYVGYLVGTDGHALHVTTWTGAHLARVVRHTVSRSGWHGSEVHTWRAIAPDGSEWYGRNAGIGMVTTMRRARTSSR
jgi:hypothetical protein